MESHSNAVTKTSINVKHERYPQSDENQNTPLRDERDSTPDRTGVANISAAGWNSDADTDPREDAITPSPPTSYSKRLMKSPRIEEEQSTTPRHSDDRNNVVSEPSDDMTTTPVEPGNLSSPNVDVKFKLEEPDDLQLDFLDALSDVDLAGLTNLEDETVEEPFIKTEPNPPKSEGEMEEGEIAEELKALTDAHNKLLKELEIKENETEKLKKRKHKKEKKHKRHRRQLNDSPDPDPDHRSHSSERSRKLQRRHDNDSFTSRHVARIQVKDEPVELDYVKVRDAEKSLKIINMDKLMQGGSGSGAAVVPVVPAALTIREKRQLAVERVKAVLHLKHLQSLKTPETEFLVVDTIRKLPSSGSFLSSALFENPSPLCNNFNVNYMFNSTTKTKINLRQWGLESMPSETTKLMRLTGINVTRLMELQNNSKMSLHKLRLQQEATKANIKVEKEMISTGLFRSLATQTDARLANFTRDAANQTAPRASQQDVFWLNSNFCESQLSQQHANVMFALKELCATVPSSTFWADAIFKALHNALSIKREEVRQLAMKRTYS